MTAFLPQHQSPARCQHRQHLLKHKQLFYQYEYTHVPQVAMLKDVPIQDQFSLGWLKLVGERIMAGIANRCELENDRKAVEFHRKQHEGFRLSIKFVEQDVFILKQRVHEALHFEGRIGAPRTHAKSLEDYASMFREYGLPPIAQDFQDDRVFSFMRVAGPNPVMLQRLKSLDERLPITDQLFQVALPGDSLEAALAEGRLYLADYAMLDGAEMGTLPNGEKYLYAPLALFALAGPKRELVPVAIQCKQLPATDNPIFTPKDGWNWLIAKTIVETADGNIHECSTHLARTHLAMEAFLLATYRQLAEEHPLSLLLVPHFKGTLAINDSAWRHLISDGGAVDLLLGGSIQTSRRVAVESIQSLDVMQSLLPLTFDQRGVGDSDLFPDYPYRDDSLLYWKAITRWVNDYLGIYYRLDSDVLEDTELQAWGREIASQDGGRLRGLPSGGSPRTIEELASLISFVIYTCSVQHAAVNFPQADYMTYAPNMPLAGYRPAPTSTTGATEQDFLAMLPTLDMAELQMEVCSLLGGVHYTVLGEYESHHFGDPRVWEPLRAFQDQVAAIGREIQQRNQQRRPYPTLVPGSIPQSINI